MVLYTLYFIFYSYIHLSLSLFFSLPSPPFASPFTPAPLAFPPRCTTTRLHAERARRSFLRAQILCRWRTRSDSDLASFDSDTLALHSMLFLHFSLFAVSRSLHHRGLSASSRTPPLHRFVLFFSPFSSPTPLVRVVGETFFRSITFIGRPPFVRAPGPRYYPLINCCEKKINKTGRPCAAKNSNRGEESVLGTCMRELAHNTRPARRSPGSFVSNGSFGRCTGERDRTAGNDRSGLV